MVEKMRITDPKGREIGFLNADVDIDVAKDKDFEFEVQLGSGYEFGSRIFVPGTEYGGLMEDREVVTKDKKEIWRGFTWRGLLTQKVVEPPKGQDHLVLNGDIAECMAKLIDGSYPGLMRADADPAGIQVSGWLVDRYVTVCDAAQKLVDAYGCRLNIEYIEPDGTESGYVVVGVRKVVDWSEDLEHSQESKLDFDVRDYRRGINHLVCVGQGQNEERIVIHLYVQKDGSIGTEQHYTGVEERAAVYNYTSAEAEKLREDGETKLKELQNYKSMSVDINDVDLQVGDIISGYETITDTSVVKPIANKIYKTDGEDTTIEYEVKGDD